MTRWMVKCLIMSVAATMLATLASGQIVNDDDVEAGTIGTGILGEITGLGSIHVNGLRIEVPPELSVTSALGGRPSDQLSVGETVVIEAVLLHGTYQANALRNYYPIIAPVEAISQAELHVLGRRLDIRGLAVPGVMPGDWVAISGLWHGAEIDVSHVRLVAPQDAVTVTATFTENSDGQQFAGPFELRGPPLVHVSAGDVLRVSGQADQTGYRLAPAQVEIGLFANAVETALIEGYMSAPDLQGIYYIHGSGAVFVTENFSMRVPTGRGIYCVQPDAPTSFTQVFDLAPDRTGRIEFLEGTVSVARSQGTSLDCF